MLITSMGLLVCASCGGGGGGGGGVTPPPPNPMALPITADNAQDITEVVLESITGTVEIIDIVDVVGLPGFAASNQGLAKPTVRDIHIQIMSCDTGDVTVTWNDADDDLTISTGDTFDAAFDMCFFIDPGITLDGTTMLNNIVVVGDPVNEIAPWRFAMTFVFDNLSGSDSTGTATINGSLDLDMNSDDNVVVNLSVGTASLTVQENAASQTLSEYSLTQTIDVNALTQAISSDGTLTSTLLDGSITFETLQEFMIFAGDNPSSGQLLIFDDTSSVLVTVLDNMSVQLEIDLSRDGTIDETIVVTWQELDID